MLLKINYTISWIYCLWLLRNKDIRFVPFTNVNVDVVTAMEVVSLCIRLVEVVGAVHSRDHFGQEILCTTFEVFVIPIRIDLDIIATKVDVALLNSQHQRAMVANRKACFDAILFSNSFDSGGQLCFMLLTHVRHLVLLLCFAILVL